MIIDSVLGSADLYGVWGTSNQFAVVGFGGIGGYFGSTNVGTGSSGAYAAANDPVAGGFHGHNAGTGPGVQGTSGAAKGGYGVVGTASNDATSTDVAGVSTTGFGFVGSSGGAPGTTAGAATLHSNGGFGLVAQSSNIAGYFGPAPARPAGGNVIVAGALTVLGAKSAAVRDEGGALRRMYSVESPESWFEDFGSGRLVNGSAAVALPADFAQLVRTDSYRVFLTPDGETEMLHVTGKTPAGFQVRESRGGASNAGFDYRVVAKRKHIPGTRLEHVDEPSQPALPPLPPEGKPLPPLPQPPRR